MDAGELLFINSIGRKAMKKNEVGYWVWPRYFPSRENAKENQVDRKRQQVTSILSWMKMDMKRWFVKKFFWTSVDIPVTRYFLTFSSIWGLWETLIRHQRGRHPTSHKLSEYQMQSIRHHNAYSPAVSHYRRKHAPPPPPPIDGICHPNST